MLIDQLVYNLLFRWLVGLNPNDPVWHPITFIKNRDRLLNEALMAKFLELLLAVPAALQLNPSLHKQRRGPAVQESPGRRRFPDLHGPLRYGEPQRDYGGK